MYRILFIGKKFLEHLELEGGEKYLFVGKCRIQIIPKYIVMHQLTKSVDSLWFPTYVVYRSREFVTWLTIP